MPLSRNEIKARAHAFAKEWGEASDERAQSQSFWIEFFAVFGISSRRIASFEHAVKKHGGGRGFVDLFWHGMLLIEHKSRGKSLERACNTDAERVAFLFERYQRITSLLPTAPARRARRRVSP